MVEEEIAAADTTAPAPVAETHKRKHQDLEQQQEGEDEADVAPPPDSEVAAKEQESEEGEGKGEEDGDFGGSEAKRPRLDEESGGLATENGHQAEQPGEVSAEDGQEVSTVDAVNEPEIAADDEKLEDDQGLVEKASDGVTEEPNSTENEAKVDGQVSTGDEPQPNDSPLSAENTELGKGVAEEQVVVAQPQEGLVTGQEYSETGAETISRKLEVPNNKVGVLIGRGGETIRFLQHNSGAKIQITKDADADPRSTSRPVELVGTLESINKAEKLIKDVIAEADAGGSPALVARGFTVSVTDGAVEQVEIEVPNEKVGFIIGKGGETIKSLQTRSGARIQLIPQHSHDGDQSKGRTIRVSGDRKQIEIARELINEIMNQPIRSSQSSHSSHVYRGRGSGGASQWGNCGSHAHHRAPYEYQNRGHYQSQYQQYSPYGSHNPRSSYGSRWEPRPQHMPQGVPHAQSGGYNYYGGQGHGSASNVGPHSQANYNYGPPRGDYGHQQGSYSQTAAPQQQTYGQGQNLQQQPYGGPVTSQPGSYPDSSATQGYGYQQPQQQFNRQATAPYGAPSHVPAQQQSYAPPTAAGQAGNMQYYQAPNPLMQPYAQNVPQEQVYPYASSGYAQAPYGQAAAPVGADGYSQVPPAVATYPQQGYAQPASAYSQAVPVAGAYDQYPQTQQAYGDQVGAVAGYGYQQAQVDPAYAQGQVYNAGAAAAIPQGYAQPAAVPTPVNSTAPNQVGYDQSGGYAGAPTSANASAPATAPASAA
ncbi:hypothetical protein Droror1_Dr00006168 [Drosera rotundifolia]